MFKKEEQKLKDYNVIKAYENSNLLTVTVKIVISIIITFCLWELLHEYNFIFKLDKIIIIFVCIWQMYRQNDVLCYVTKEGLVVKRKTETFKEWLKDLVDDKAFFVCLDYEEIIAFADDWDEIHLGQLVEGGIAIVKVRLKYLSKKDKQEIIDFVKEEKEN